MSKAGLPKKAKLSRREKEVLSCAAKGKSNGVIADILSITESTVITYLERAFKKTRGGQPRDGDAASFVIG
ncbi:MAG: hypothetical protein Pars2KO_33020 [Parasphingorhabdus sp.]